MNRQMMLLCACALAIPMSGCEFFDSIFGSPEAQTAINAGVDVAQVRMGVVSAARSHGLELEEQVQNEAVRQMHQAVQLNHAEAWSNFNYLMHHIRERRNGGGTVTAAEFRRMYLELCPIWPFCGSPGDRPT